MKKRSKIFSFALFFILGTIFFSFTASAYIDPSAMTYIVQVIVGIVIAGGAAFGFYFNKLRRKLKKKDENQEDYDVQEEVDFSDDAEFDDSDITEDDFDNSDEEK